MVRAPMLVVVLALACRPAVAQTQGAPPHPDAAHRLALSILDQTHAVAQMRTVIGLLRGQMVLAIARGGKTKDQAAHIVDTVLMPDLNARIGEMIPAIAEIWTENLSLADLRALRDFYRSPAGQHLLAKQQVIATESFRVGAAIGTRIVREAIKRHADELRRLGVEI